MRTSKLISTISYQTPDYLKLKLRELQKQGIIEFWAFILHKPDESVLKQHIHLLVYPAKTIQTNDLRKVLQTTIFTPTKYIAEWYLYVTYETDDELVTSDKEILQHLI